MKNIYDKTTAPGDNDEITIEEVLRIVCRSRATFDKLKSEGLIAPICVDGKRYLYRRGDARILRQKLKIYL